MKDDTLSAHLAELISNSCEGDAIAAAFELGRRMGFEQGRLHELERKESSSNPYYPLTWGTTSSGSIANQV